VFSMRPAQPFALFLVVLMLSYGSQGASVEFSPGGGGPYVFYGYAPTADTADFWEKEAYGPYNATLVIGVLNISVLIGMGGWDFGGATMSSYTYPWNLGDDIAVLGARAGQTFGFYAPTQAVIFAPEDLALEIEELCVPMKKDGYHVLLSGAHAVRATGPIIVEVLGEVNAGADWPQDWHPVVWRGYDDWASYLVSPQALELSYPEPQPVASTAQLAAYVSAGVGLAAAAMAALLLLRRRRAARSTA